MEQTPTESLPQSNSAPTQPDSEPKKYSYSYSRLSDQARCPARLHFRELAKQGKIKTDINLPAIFGSAVHKGVEERLKHETNPFTAAKDFLREELEKNEYTLFNSKEYQDKYSLLTDCLNNFETDFYPYLREQVTDPEHQVELQLETPFRKGILVGKIDLALTDVFVDFKSSARMPSDIDVVSNPQSGFYWLLAQKTGMVTPKEFVYVYLKGQNLAKIRSKTGKPIPDKNNKMMRYSFSVHPTEESVNRLLNNFIIPLAKAYEEGIIYKNPSAMNCTHCPYRTACWSFDLPSIND